MKLIESPLCNDAKYERVRTWKRERGELTRYVRASSCAYHVTS